MKSRLFAILIAIVVVMASCSVATNELANVEISEGTRVLQADEDSGPAPTTGDAGDPGDPGQDGDVAPTPSAASPAPTASDPDGSDSAGQGAALAEDEIGSDGAGDRYYPTYGNGGYDVLSYDLAFVWDDDSREIDSVATITMVATQTLSRFNLDLVGFEVTSINVDNSAATFERQGRELIITPADTLERDATAQVTIAYNGLPTLLQSIGAPFSTGWNDFGDTIVVAGEPEGAAGWYPVNEHPIDKATYRIAITADADLTVAANGTQVSVTENGDQVTWVYESNDPQASYLTTVAIGDFRFHQGEPSASGVPVRHFFHEDIFDQGVATMERTHIMIDEFERLFGPYPFENYGSVVVSEGLGFALETQTLSVFGSDLVDSFASREDVVAHELAHQWFGNHISLGQWSDIWLNEGFATYSEYLWLEAIEPGYDIDAAVRADYDALFFLIQTPPGAPPAGDLFNASVYLRGGFTLHALRTTIGDDNFFVLIDTYVREFGGANAETSDFTSLAEDISGQDLEAFFQGWLFDTEVPPLPE